MRSQDRGARTAAVSLDARADEEHRIAVAEGHGDERAVRVTRGVDGERAHRAGDVQRLDKRSAQRALTCSGVSGRRVKTLDLCVRRC